MTFRKLTILLSLCSLSHIGFGQGFQLISNQFSFDYQNYNADDGMGVSFFDFDGDGWDDLTYVFNNDSIRLVKNNNGVFEPLDSPLFIGQDAKNPIWVDYDNDGDYDLFISVMLGPSKLLRNDGIAFTDVSQDLGIPQDSAAMSYGASWGDYDKDGLLDCYICNYNWPSGYTNWLLHNNGDGTFTEMAAELGVDNSSNASYQSAWLDYNNDGWPDLYVINDKAIPCALFKNLGNGTFEDVSESSGAGIAIHAMCITTGDFDNDGDLDIYITNEPYGNSLLVNDGAGSFDDYGSAAGVALNKLSWGSTWIDYDNNLKRDLYVCTNYFLVNNQNYLLINTGTTFVDGSWLGVDNETHFSFGVAKGDYNNDGYYDLAVSNNLGDPQDFYKNLGGDNNYVKIDLEGTISNKDAVGTWLTYWLGTDKYVEYTQCGEGYLSQESHYEILPLGASDVIDSLQIEWPSGLVENYYDIPGNTTVKILEDYLPSFTVTGNLAPICDGITSELGFEEAFDGYLWSNGDTTSTTIINGPGTYFAEVVYNGGLSAVSPPIVIDSLPLPDFALQISDISCFGEQDGSLEIVSNDAGPTDLVWSNDSTTLSISNLSPGIYSYTLTDTAGCVQTDSIQIFQPDSIQYELLFSSPSCFGWNDGSVEVNCTGAFPCELTLPNTTNLVAGTYSTEVVDSNGCSATAQFEITEPEELTLSVATAPSTGSDGSASAEVFGGTPPYEYLWSNLEEGISINNLSPGSYGVTVTDSHGCEAIFEFNIEAIDNIPDNRVLDTRPFPNPCSNYLNVPSLKSDDVLVFVDSRGVSHVIEHENEGLVSLSHLTNGIYSLHIQRMGAVLNLGVVVVIKN